MSLIKEILFCRMQVLNLFTEFLPKHCDKNPLYPFPDTIVKKIPEKIINTWCPKHWLCLFTYLVLLILEVPSHCVRLSFLFSKAFQYFHSQTRRNIQSQELMILIFCSPFYIYKIQMWCCNLALPCSNCAYCRLSIIDTFQS